MTAFDIVGFSLEYELCYTNVLAMLRLAGIPLRAADRDEHWPLIIAGGPCVCNAEPMADFFDVMQLGEGRTDAAGHLRHGGAGEKAGLEQGGAACWHWPKIPGVYVPSFYDVSVSAGRPSCRHSTPNRPGIPAARYQGHRQRHG